MTSSLKQKAISGVLYRGAELIGVQGIQLIVSIVLARLLLPEEFGAIALVNVFIQVFSCLIVVGFPSALIQKKNTSIEEESTVFYLNIIIAFVIYFVLYNLSPFIATFYNIEILTSVIRVISLIIIINALSQVHSALLTKEIDFKSMLKVNLIALLTSGVIGVSLAYSGYGIWSLVYQQLSSAIVRTLILWYVSNWRPQKIFKISSLKDLFSFGFKLMLSGLIGTVFNNLYVLFIGKVYSPIDLAYYSRSKQLPWVILNTTSGVISSVMFPTFSKINDDPKRLKNVAKKILKMTYFLVCPISIGLIITAEPLVLFLLTDKWLPIVPYLQLIVVMYFFLPMQGLNLEILKSLGHSGLYLKMEILKKILLVVGLLSTYKFGVLTMIYGQVILGSINVVIDSFFTKKMIGYSTLEQFKDISGSMIYSLIMGGVCYISISHLPDGNLTQLIMLSSLGGTVYIILSFLTKNESLYQVFEIIRSRS